MKEYKSHFIKQKKKKLYIDCAIGSLIWTTAFFLLYFYIRSVAYHVRYPEKHRLAVFQFMDQYLFLWWVLGAVIVVLLTGAVISHKVCRSFDYTLDFMKQLWQNPDAELAIRPGEDDIYNLLEFFQNQFHETAGTIKQEQQRKNDLVLYLTHDLKTPLTSVQGYLDIVLEQPQLPEDIRQKYLRIAQEKAERLEELINEFFEISRFSLTDIQVTGSQVNFGRLIEQEVFEFQPMLKEKSQICQSEVPKDYICVCDPDKMQRVIDNLLRNAVNYGYPNSVIYMKMIEDETNNCLEIRNQGDTIPREVLDRLFEQFFRLDTSRSSKTGGSGIGLAVARKIMEAHGGKIIAESQNNWIIFRISWPK